MKKRRNFDIKSNSSEKRSLLLPIGLSLLLVVSSALVFVFFQKNDNSADLLSPIGKDTINNSSLAEQNNPDPVKNDSSFLATPDFTTGEKTTTTLPATDSLYLFLDGWSYQLLTKKTISIYDATTNESASATFKALSKDELKKLYPTNFLALSTVVARLYPVTGILNCDEKGCSDELGTIDLYSLLTDLGKTPKLGEQYKNENLTQGIYLAEFKIRPTTSGLNLTYGDASSIVISVPKINIDEVNPGAVFLPSPYNAYGMRSVALGYAFSKAFLLDPLWVKKQGKFESGSFNGDLSTLSIKQIAQNPPFLKLNESNAYLQNQLTDSELTFRSSPSTGCSSLTICTILKSNPTIETLTNKNFNFCTAQGKVSGLYWQGRVTLDNKNAIFLGGLYNPNKISQPNQTYITHALYLLDSAGVVTITSDRTLTKATPWSSSEIESYLGNNYKICK